MQSILAIWQPASGNPAIQQSSNPAILLHDIPHLAINRCCLLICNSDFNFNKFLHQKICQRGFINFIGIQLVPEMGLGTSWIWFGLGFGGSKPQTVDVFGQYCPQQCVHMHVDSCLLLLLCAALLTSLCKPFICPIIQPEAILFDTHIPQAPRTFRPLYTVCTLSLPSRVSHKLEHFHDTCKFPAASHPHRLEHSSSHQGHTHTRTRHTSPCSYWAHTIWKKWYPHPHCVCVM